MENLMEEVFPEYKGVKEIVGTYQSENPQVMYIFTSGP